MRLIRFFQAAVRSYRPRHERLASAGSPQTELSNLIKAVAVAGPGVREPWRIYQAVTDSTAFV